MDLGLVTFADLHPGLSPAERMRDLLEEARLADELGLKVFAVGEHHRPDYLVSSPSTALAAIAAVTEQIRLSSAVSVLSSDDPVRVFEQFAHVDLISGGRAEIMAGRGSFIESFPLFGYDLRDYDELFTEKLDLLLAIRDNERVTWQGEHRAPLEDAIVWPRPVQDQLPVWVAVGGTPESVVRAASRGCRWHSRSSAVRQRGSSRSSISTGAPGWRPGRTGSRASESTPTRSSRTRAGKPTQPSPRRTWR